MERIDDIRRLEVLNTILGLDAFHGLTALVTKDFLDLQFYGRSKEEREEIFSNNVTNNVLYQANYALAQQSIVAFYERLVGEEKLFGKYSIPFPDQVELRKHRHIISHPANVYFRDEKVQDFWESDEHYTDNVALRIFRTMRIIENRLKESEATNVKPFFIQLGNGTAHLVHGVLSLSYKPGNGVPDIPTLYLILTNSFRDYQEKLEKMINNPLGKEVQHSHE